MFKFYKSRIDKYFYLAFKRIR